MDYRALTVSAALAAAITGFAPICRADIIASDQGIAVRDAGVAAPARGMSMAQVASKFGDPLSKIPAVGNPPISRWEYSGFVVYFERDHVIHAVVSASAPAEPSGAAAAPASAPPAEAASPPPESAPAAESAPVPAPAAAAPAPVAAPAPPQAAAAEAPAAPPPAAATAAPSAAAESEAAAQP